MKKVSVPPGAIKFDQLTEEQQKDQREKATDDFLNAICNVGYYVGRNIDVKIEKAIDEFNGDFLDAICNAGDNVERNHDVELRKFISDRFHDLIEKNVAKMLKAARYEIVAEPYDDYLDWLVENEKPVPPSRW